MQLLGALIKSLECSFDSKVLRRTGADFSNATVAVFPDSSVALKRLREDIALAWAQSVFIDL